MNILRRHAATIPLIILLTILIYNALKSHECEGPAEVFIIIILTIVSILLVFGTSLYYFFKHQKESVKFQTIPLQVSLAFFIIYMVGKTIISFDFKGAPYLTAEKKYGDIVTLYKDNTYKITDTEIEWRCFYSGSYKINGDTIKLDKASENLLDKGFYSNYLKRNDFLIPIQEDTLITDSSVFLNIN